MTIFNLQKINKNIQIFLKNLAIILAFFFVKISLSNATNSQFVSNEDITSEIEQTLLFDKAASEKFDIYNNELGENLLQKPTFGASVSMSEVGQYSTDNMNIILVDKLKINKDLREKEKLAYNSALIGQYEIAVQLYKEILQKEPKNNYAKFSLAVVYQRLNQIKQAKNIYYEILKSDAENRQEVINNLIAIFIEESPREAMYFLKRLTMQNPESDYLFSFLGLAYEKISDLDSAINSYERAVKLSDNNISYLYNLAVIYDKKQNYEKAMEIYSIVLKNSQNFNSEIPLEDVKNRIETIKSLS